MAPNNPLPVYGNEKTMNLNSLILANIQSSPYFKVNLFELKTYHQVIDEIYYKVEHLEPWEKGSRKTAGQTGMCGGVRGVGAGGIVSSAYCLLYKLFTLKLTKKQVIGLITHADSPYIRALGFMYIRYTQNPGDLWEWYSPYLDDEEELDVKAGGGHMIKIGDILRQWTLKLEWYSTLFPRVPVPIQKQNENKLKEYELARQLETGLVRAPIPEPEPPAPTNKPQDGRAQGRQAETTDGFGEAERIAKLRESPSRGGSADRKRDRSSPVEGERERDRHRPPHQSRQRSRSRERERENENASRHRSRSRDRERENENTSRHRSRDRERENENASRHRSRSRDRERERQPHREKRDRGHKRSRSRDRKRSRSRDRKRSRSRERKRSRSRERGHRHRRSRSRERNHGDSSFDRELRREKERIKNGR